jgi:hypothetical protein
MECSSYIEEKAGQSESPEFLRHLASCAGCQRDVEEMDDVRSLYRSASTERYTGGVPHVRRFGLGSWLSATAAAGAMIAALVFLLGHPGTKPPAEIAATATPFYRIHLEPWPTDARFNHAVDDCWRELDRLERSR